MTNKSEATHRRILENAKTILLIDWPDPFLPFSLLKTGFTVFGYSPDDYFIAEFNSDSTQKIGRDEMEKLVFRKLDDPPESVDIVNIFRPEAEHADIIRHHVLPLKAKIVWLHPPLHSQIIAETAKKNSLVFVEGVNIADVAQKITGRANE